MPLPDPSGPNKLPSENLQYHLHSCNDRWGGQSSSKIGTERMNQDHKEEIRYFTAVPSNLLSMVVTSLVSQLAKFPSNTSAL